MNEWRYVFATHEEPQELATGPWRGDEFVGVALPCHKALGKMVEIEYQDRSVIAECADVGPFCCDDEMYVFGGSQSRADIYKGKFCPLVLGGTQHDDFICNGSGIDLFPGTANELGIPLNTNVMLKWRFVE